MAEVLKSLRMKMIVCELIYMLMKSTSTSTSTSTPPKNCPITYCGEVKIRYPFWVRDNTSEIHYCGYSGFGLQCLFDKKLAVFNTSNDSYYVRSINYTDTSLTLVDRDAADQSCPRVQHNLTLETTTHLSYSQHDFNLTFYFNCSFPTELETPFAAYRINCFEYSPKPSYVVPDNHTDHINWAGFCQDKVVTPVMETTTNLIDGFGKAINGGFSLDWKQLMDCASCEDTDGFCGHSYSQDHSLCFCPDNSTHPTRCGGKGPNYGLKIGIGLAAAFFTFIIMFIIFVIHRRIKKHDIPRGLLDRNISSEPSSAVDLGKDSTYYGVPIFSYEELVEATHNFDPSKELGDGGFGTVYYGKLWDGRAVAVKRLYNNNYKRVEQFMNEVKILTLLRHQNLVSLYGCTSHHSRELILVYEYIANGTVADHLHGERGSLMWSTRLSIAIETASALSYLHASDIIHRDVKTSNILLDTNYCVKVADFGLSRLFPLDVTHVSTAPQGTPGYVDPEYNQCYQLTTKSDVYSFGVVLIELISSKPAVDITRHRREVNLSAWALSKIQKQAFHELVDPSLGFESDNEVRDRVTAVAELAFGCLQDEKEMRPSMEQVLETLKAIQSHEYQQLKQEVQLQPPLSPDTVIAPLISNASTPNPSA